MCTSGGGGGGESGDELNVHFWKLCGNECQIIEVDYLAGRRREIHLAGCHCTRARELATRLALRKVRNVI